VRHRATKWDYMAWWQVYQHGYEKRDGNSTSSCNWCFDYSDAIYADVANKSAGSVLTGVHYTSTMTASPPCLFRP